MARYIDGDGEAFEALFERYEPRAYVFFLRRTGSRERAQDLYQELFLRIHRGRESYQPSRSFTPWFFQIANRLLIDDHRRAFRDSEVLVDDPDTCAVTSGRDTIVADREYVGQALEALSPEERYVVVSAKVEGFGYPEIAEHLGKSADAVRQMASRALRRMREAALLESAQGASIG